MALYKDGNPVSGLNSIPRLTLAEYNALNVKPEFWVRTDAPESYKKLSADQVSYDSDNTVKDKIDDLQLDNYTSANNMFTIRKQGNLASILLNGSNASFKSDGITLSDTIPTGYRPTGTHDLYTKVYNGSSYTECRFRVDSYGNVQFMTMTGGAISGIQLQYIVNNNMVYSFS